MSTNQIDWRLLPNNMIRGGQTGIPVDPENPSMGLEWKWDNEITEEDIKKLARYFEIKQQLKP